VSSLFGSKNRGAREAERQEEQAQQLRRQAKTANQYDEMVTKALERLTRWAFPDSQVERPKAGEWQLWHTAEGGTRYVDVAVTLQFRGDRPVSFLCHESLYMADAELTREDLDEALRRCICSLSG
jgi:hypothetical protein